MLRVAATCVVLIASAAQAFAGETPDEKAFTDAILALERAQILA